MSRVFVAGLALVALVVAKRRLDRYIEVEVAREVTETLADVRALESDALDPSWWWTYPGTVTGGGAKAWTYKP